MVRNELEKAEGSGKAPAPLGLGIFILGARVISQCFLTNLRKKTR